MKKILLLGSGELGKELVISLKRLGCHVRACDSYDNAPAQQVTDSRAVIDMLDGEQVMREILDYKPDLIVPEIEAIRTEVLVEAEEKGFTVIPSARAVNLTMNRDHIRDRAHELGLKTAKFEYAESLADLKDVTQKLGFPLVVKPVMSSSGKGQSLISDKLDVEQAWSYAVSGMRGDRKRVIAEEFIDFDYEITLLTIKQNNAPTIFCKSIGHHQERGDYQYSWQPSQASESVEKKAQEMAKIITDDLGGVGIFGVEFFIRGHDVIFSELSPRPHDTGLVTLFTQSLSEFDLHARAILGYPIYKDFFEKEGASHVVLAAEEKNDFTIKGVEQAMKEKLVDVRVFGKPNTRKYRRMAVVLGPNVDTVKKAAGSIEII